LLTPALVPAVNEDRFYNAPVKQSPSSLKHPEIVSFRIHLEHQRLAIGNDVVQTFRGDFLCVTANRKRILRTRFEKDIGYRAVHKGKFSLLIRKRKGIGGYPRQSCTILQPFEGIRMGFERQNPQVGIPVNESGQNAIELADVGPHIREGISPVAADSPRQ